MTQFRTMLEISAGALVFVVIAGDAQAYLDPGTTSLVVQAVVATIAGGLLFFRRSWTRVKSKLTARKPQAEESGEPSA
jgi:O-antigen/teichoic acid export membrane protein